MSDVKNNKSHQSVFQLSDKNEHHCCKYEQYQWLQHTHTHMHTHTHKHTCVQYDIYLFQWVYVDKIFIGMNCISDNMKGENNRLLDGMSSTNLKKYLEKSI